MTSIRESTSEARIPGEADQGISRRAGCPQLLSRAGVERAIRELGAAYLTHPENEQLRSALQSGRLEARVYYQQLLRMVFRLLILLIAEQRGGRADPEDVLELGGAACPEADLLRVRTHLSGVATIAAGDGVEVLGSIYESLLGYRLTIDATCVTAEERSGQGRRHRSLQRPPLRLQEHSIPSGAASWTLDLIPGDERRRSGSYYTPAALVDVLIDVTLAPVMEERLAIATTREEKEAALLGLRVCDPACGTGHVLLAAARRIADELVRVRCGGEGRAGSRQQDEGGGPLLSRARPTSRSRRTAQSQALDMDRASLRDVIQSCLYGIDQDLVAVEICRAVLWIEAGGPGPRSAAEPRGLQAFLENHIVCGDALFPPHLPALPSEEREAQGDDGQFDVVLGNPPYVDSERLAKGESGFRRRVAATYVSARGNRDLYVPFVELAARLTRPGGAFALVTPGKLVASDYCSALQQMLLELSPTTYLDFSGLRPFAGAGVSVGILAVRKTAGKPDREVRFVRYSPHLLPERTAAVTLGQLRALPAGYMGAPLTLDDPALLEIVSRHAPLSSIARVSDGATTAEAYEIRAVVRDVWPCPDQEDPFVRLVNTGTIEPFHTLWGVRAIAYLGFRGKYPAVPREELARIAPRRLEQADSPKVLVGGMGDRIEAAPALGGVLCGKSAVLILPREGICPFALAVVLNSTLLSRIYRGLFGLRGFSPRSMAIGPRQVERLPGPPIETLAPCVIFEEASSGQLLGSEETAWLSALSPEQLEQQVLERRLLSRIGRTLHHRLTPAKMDLHSPQQHTTAGVDHLLSLAERAVGLAFGIEHAVRDPDSERR